MQKSAKVSGVFFFLCSFAVADITVKEKLLGLYAPNWRLV